MNKKKVRIIKPTCYISYISKLQFGMDSDQKTFSYNNELRKIEEIIKKADTKKI